MAGAATTDAGGGLGGVNAPPDRNLKRSLEKYCSPSDLGISHQKSFKAKSRTRWPAKRPPEFRAETSIREENEADTVAVQDAVKWERRRISRDLHDHAGQYLVGMALRLAALEQTIADPAQSGAFAELRLLLDRFSQELRAISQGERQGVPFGCDLTAVLRNLAGQWERETGIAVRFHSERVGNHYVPDDVTMETLYRIAQEALTNIAKHATHASHVWVRLAVSPEFICLAVEDDGPGLGPARADGDKRPLRSGGITNMQERLAERGGRLVICSPPAGGTSVVATVPINGHLHREGAGPNERSYPYLSR